jgi:DNA polymerase-3 subunit alpha
VYQEQMMRIATDLAGYTLPEADTLRKAIGKKIKELLDEQESKLVSGMIKNGIPEKIAKEIWELFPPFARYGFNKSHAACYALIAYRTAYLKAHYPEEFTASLMNGEAGDVERISFLITEARQEGIEILPPDVNASYARFVPDGPKRIRFGLLAVKNVGDAIAQALIDERSLRGPYKDFNDVLTRVQHKDLNKKSLESLAKAGIFDSLGVERNQIIENLDEIVKFTSALKKSGTQANSLFGPSAPTVTLTLKLKEAPPATAKQKLAWEKELLGFYLNDHPLRPFREKFQQIKARTLDELRGMRNEDTIIRTAGLVSQIKKIVTKNGQNMLFVHIEDFSPKPMEVVVFARTLERTGAVWQDGNIVVLEGKLSLRDAETKVICERAQVLET